MKGIKKWFKKEEHSVSSQMFSESWMSEWKTAINKNEEYRKSAAGWNLPLILKFSPLPSIFRDKNSIGFFLDLRAGVCHELRYAKDADLEKNAVVLSGSYNIWINLLQSGKDPTMLLMKGKLKVEKGSLVMLTTHSKSAKALLKSAPVYEIPGESVIKSSSLGAKTSSLNTNSHTSFKTTSNGIDFDSFPMKLFQKAKVYGIWNPSDISFEKDKIDWLNFTSEEKKIITHLSALFMAGEEAVTLDLLPLIRVVAKEGRIEEEIYLTSFLWEEAKHTEFFSLFVKQVMVNRPDFESFHGPLYKNLFYEKLPEALNALDYDTSPFAQLKASGTYNLIVEGTLAETGYEAYYKMLKENNLLPGLQEGILKLKQDESRHIAYGLYFINRLLNENSDLEQPFEDLLEKLLTDATNIIHEIFEPYHVVPFGLDKNWFINYAIKQFQYRLEKLKLNN